MASITDQVADFFKGGDNETSLRELFLHTLKDIYYAERKLTEALPRMEEAATSSELKTAFRTHLAETQQQVGRLEQVFNSIGEEAEEVTCEAMDGLVEESEETISDTKAGTLTRDAGLIISAQKVEHYEIASYGSLRTLAQMLGYTQAAQLLEQTLEEEKKTDAKLTQVAESYVNQRAAKEM
ncbi:YciE/YciF ferroxidase family protein [Tellurirhabdus rosea]|uniref:YciE/YciF ferroxidase family protein n=1 Tax=Tellurirhabdus rosea TaxID=2674997 RepID=UPI00225A5B53|nr:ferritin-like domain-containing protein [Tellurirhabdus rosea]